MFSLRHTEFTGTFRMAWTAFCMGIALVVLQVCAPLSHAQSVTVTNVFQNHYNYGYPIGDQSCPSGYNIPAGQYPSTYHLERGHAIHHQDPSNSANDYWVYWAHFDNSSYGVAEVAVFKSTTECGPYILQTGLYSTYNTDGGGYGFQPGGWQSRDEIIFRDTDQSYNSDGTVSSYASAYLISASDSENTVASSSGSTCSYANDSMAIFKLTPDYLGIDATTNTATNGANWAFVCDQREAPVMFRKDNMYFLITSQAAGWYPSQGGYGVSSNPLTGWTSDPINLGNTSTFGGQTSDGFTIQGTQDNTYVLTFDHLGGADSKNPSGNEQYDTGEIWLPVLLDSSAGTATLNWYASWTVDNTTGVLTLPTLNNLANGASATATVTSASANPPSDAIDGNYTTRWASSSTGSTSFSAAKPATSTLCPVTDATSSTTCNPSLIVDLGSVQPVQEIDLSQYMVKGSEPYYTYKIAYSSDDANWTTLDYTAVASAADATANNIGSVPFSNNITYGFNALPVNFSARYVALIETGAITQNSTSAPYTSFYGPNLYEMAVIQSTAPAVPQPVTVAVTPSTETLDPGSPLTVNVAVAGPSGQPAPTGYVQLSAPNYISETYGLVGGTSSFTIPAGALPGGPGTITVNYRPDPTSVPIYGIGAIAGAASVTVSSPDAPATLTVTASSPGALLLAWSSVAGASSYVVNRSVDGGNTYTQFATASSTSYIDAGLTNGTQYCYTVASVNGAGAGQPTAAVCGMVTSSFPVTGIEVTPSGPGALTVSYNSLANATGYLIKRAVSGGAYATLTTATSTSYQDTGLATDGTSYCYTVAAVFSTGTAADSAPVCSAATASFAPSNLEVTQWAPGQLYVTWLANGTGSFSYALKRSVNGGTFTAVGPAQTALTYTDANLTNYSSVYCYVVDEVLNGVTSGDSLSVCNTPTSNFLIVADYSFEQPVVSLWSTQQSFLDANGGYGWAFVGNTNNSGDNSGISALSGTFTNANTPPIALGIQVGLLEGTGSMTQSVSGFTVGQNYTVAVVASQRQTSYQSGGAEPFAIEVNGVSLGTLAPPQSIPYYRDYSLGFTATAATNTIALVGASSSTTSAVLLDNVRITTAGSSAFAIGVLPASVSYASSSATLSASVSLSSATSPSGLLVFQVDSGNQLPGSCSASGGVFTCTVAYPLPNLQTGAHTITATYAGDATYASAAGTATLTVTPAPTTTVVTGGSFPYDGNPHPATVLVTGAGGLSLTEEPVYSGSCTSAPVTVPQGAACTASYTYAGDANHSGSTGSATITITPVYVKTVTLQLSSTRLTYPGAANAVACVVPAASAAPTGSIQIMDGSSVLTTQALQGNGCAYWYISPGLAAGAHSLSAFYPGDANNAFGWSTPVAVTVQPVAVNLAVSCWNSSFAYGANYQCTVNASSNAGAAQGSISYVLDGHAAVSVPLANGGAQIVIPAPAAGQHTLAISYPQQGNYAGAGPAAETFTVSPAPVNVSLTPSAWYAASGTAISFTAAVSSWSAGAPNANGVISFYDGNSLLATVPVGSNGAANWSASSLAAGTHTITAAYSNGANYATGSGSVTITIAQ